LYLAQWKTSCATARFRKEIVMTSIRNHADDTDEQELMPIATFIGTMVATALTIFVLGGALLSPRAPLELAASESLLGP
jgi:hypothetical protein